MRNTVLFLLLFVTASCFCQSKSAKRGLAYNGHSAADMDVLNEGVSWWYNWYHQPESSVFSEYQNYGFEYVPMAWNGSFDKEAMRSFLQDHANVKYILGWNEPNFLEQANMTPSQAAAMWPEIEELADEFNLEIVSPAVNYCAGCVSENGTTYTDPIEYLDDFFAACSGCRVDHIAIHSYMGNVGALQWFVGLFKKYGKPIWLTEFANWENNPTLEQQKSFMIGAVDYLENEADVFRYAWFTGRHNGAPYIGVLENAQSGELTDLGEIYINMPTHDAEKYTLLPARLEAEDYNIMSGILLEATADVSGFANVGYIEANDWLEYGVEVTEDTEFDVHLRIASTAESSLEILVNHQSGPVVNIPNLQGWQNWKTVIASLSLPAGKHKIRLRALASGFNVNWIEFKNGTLTAVDSYEHAWSVYPNPVTDRFYLEKEIRPSKIELIDVLGRAIQLQLNENEVDVDDLAPGCYVLKVTSFNGKITSEKLIKR